MKHRKLRIAWSVVWGIAAMLFVALWVRSNWWVESIQMRATKTRVLVIASMPGILQIELNEGPLISFATTHQSYAEWRQFVDSIGQSPDDRSQLLVWMQHEQYSDWLRTPYWLAVVLSCTAAAAPWMRWSKRFGLRTLLIATTLVAIGLGLIVWLIKGTT